MRVIELFKEISSICRCSGIYQPFIIYLQNFAQKNNYTCKIDKANNLLMYKKNTKATICLQSHYDIVCLKDNTIPQIIEKDGYLEAKDSTLGADNGIGCAYMLALIEESYDCEFLFTCDEEIGLIGANNIQHKLQSKYMLNLDSEDEGGICIGCAGGIDIVAKNTTSKLIQNTDNKQLYEIIIDNLEGGHSGVDIDKNIPNAIKLIGSILYEYDAHLLDIKAGERINSIAKSATAIILSDNVIKSSNNNIQIKQIDTNVEHYKKLDENIIKFLYIFSHGVRSYDKELDVVLSSINLALIDTNVDNVTIQLSARSMDNKELETITKETVALLECFGFEVNTNGKYPSWKPTQNKFTTKVLNIYKKYNQNAKLEAIHAGLECAIFKEKYPNIQVCSIGPNIYFPHSLREKCEMSSIHKVYKILKDILNS